MFPFFPYVTDIPFFAHNNVTSNILDNFSDSNSSVSASTSPFFAGTIPFSSEPHPNSTNIHPMTIRAKVDIYKPKVIQTSTTQKDLEPTTYKQAMQQPPWLHAMKAEYVALLANKTWTLTPLPPGANLIGCKWVFKRKFNANGTLQRHKARLVAKGFHQYEGFDFTDTFSLVFKQTTIRVVLIMSSTDSTLVCKLHKPIYGLKQAPQSWFLKLSNTFISLSSKSDSSLFLRFIPNGTLIILIYVDDIIVTRTSSNLIECFITQLNENFALKDLGKLHYFLGIEVAGFVDGYLLFSQIKYIKDLLQRAAMLDANPQPTPMVSTSRLTIDGSTIVDIPTK